MRHPLSLFIIALMTATTVVMGAVIWSNASLVEAQTVLDPEVTALQIYEKLPDLPKENQYIHRKKKEQAVDNTLVSRLIRYHAYNQSRSPQYRLDWKITLADYSGINEYMKPRNYPGAAFLKTNPIERDQHLIQSLSRDERNELIEAIVDVFAPGTAAVNPAQPSVNQPKGSAPPSPAIVPPSENATDLLGPKESSAPNKTEDKPSGAARFLMPDETP